MDPSFAPAQKIVEHLLQCETKTGYAGQTGLEPPEIGGAIPEITG